ncbi:MAG: hypothetical protein NTW49_11720 [Bacteroidia bacterium]|nr:hypothetical protein [Bacteroidia bacterium]
MTNDEFSEQFNGKAILDKLDSLEQRIARLEMSHVNQTGNIEFVRQDSVSESYDENISQAGESETETGFETKIGEYGLAWLGNIVLLFGIIFLTQHIRGLGYGIFSALVGYLSVIIILFLSHFLKKTYSYISFVFGIFGIFLVYFTTLKLHFFTPNPVIISQNTGIFLLLLVNAVITFFGLRRKSEIICSISLLLVFCTALFSDNSSVLLWLLTASAAGAALLFYFFKWWRILIISIIFIYLTLLIWLLNNPFITHKISIVADHHYCLYYLSAIAIIFSLLTFVRKKGLFPDKIILPSVLLNGIGFSTLLLMIILAFYPADYIWIFVTISVFCLLFSIILKYQSPWAFAPALYLIYGFVTISVSIYGKYGLPGSYFLLSLQSLMVVSFALWFRSKIIIVLNTFLFLMMLFSYMFFSVHEILINFSFPVAAFISARIIHWQEKRLNIKTALIRNTFLVILFLTMLYAVYQTAPQQYVTLYWILVSLLYFLTSLVLKNIKYRWMAMATMCVTAIYLFTVDFAHLSLIYRIIAFLFLAVLSIAISIYYFKRARIKNTEEPVNNENELAQTL